MNTFKHTEILEKLHVDQLQTGLSFSAHEKLTFWFSPDSYEMLISPAKTIIISQYVLFPFSVIYPQPTCSFYMNCMHWNAQNVPLEPQTHSKETHCPGLSCRCTHVYSLQPPQPPLYMNTKLLWHTVHKWPCVDLTISMQHFPPLQKKKKAFSLRNDTQTTRLLF